MRYNFDHACYMKLNVVTEFMCGYLTIVPWIWDKSRSATRAGDVIYLILDKVVFQACPFKEEGVSLDGAGDREEMARKTSCMDALLRWMRYRVQVAVERDRRVEGGVETVSRVLWPWRERLLPALAGLLALLDYGTTYAVLELSGKDHLEEGGLLAGWVIREGGMGWLFLADVGVVLALSLMAVLARLSCLKFGFRGYGRAVFVVLLVPYAVVAVAAVINNILVALW